MRDMRGATFETLLIHAGAHPDPATGAVSPPIYAVTTYAQDSIGNPRSGYVYGRGANPTRGRWEECMATLEDGTTAVAFSSGLAAEDAILRIVCEPGSHIVMPNDVYGGTLRLLDKSHGKWGISYTPVDLGDIDAVRAAVRPGATKLIWCETPTNPLLGIADIAALSDVARASGCLLAVDNTFASPYLQQPLHWGADVVIHSSTKYLGGHSDVIGGVVITRDNELGTALKFHQNAAGAVPSPFDSWLLLRGIKTLGVRMSRQSESALSIATFLNEHPAVEKVYYPGLESHEGHEIAVKQMRGFGGMVSFLVRAGEAASVEVCNRARLFTLAESLGAVESLINHPLKMTHASVAGTDVAPPSNMVRLSVGLEAPTDLIADLTHALAP